MKRIICVLLSLFLITPCLANIHINPDAVIEVVAKHFPKKQADCIREYNKQLNASNGSGIAAAKLWNVCAAGGLNIKQPVDKEKCRTFVNELINRGTVKFYAACGNDKDKSGAVCVNIIYSLTVNMQQAQGLAKLYARSKSDNIITCRKKAYMVNSVLCTSHNSNKFYEFRFKSVDGNIDATNHKNFKTGICKIFGHKYAVKKYDNKNTFDICEEVKDESACNKMNQVISAGNIGYIASWGPLDYRVTVNGYRLTADNFPYCVLEEQIALSKDGVLLFEQTAFRLDGRIFLNAGIQRKGSKEIKQQIRTYVENTMGKANVKSFSCEDTYHTVKLKGRSGKDDMLRCTINDKVVEFFFDDLSEAWGIYDKSGREATTCIAWGGTFTGKKCIGLDKKMCNVVRDANAQSCPECKLIKWNPDTKTCDLPSSASATSLKKGLNYAAIVGGTVVSVVVTVGTMGAASAPTALIITGLAVEMLGAGIELTAQINIDRTADKFFTQSTNCHDSICAKKLIIEYLQTMSNQQNDMLEEELIAADFELARLANLIPEDDDFYQDLLKNNSINLADNKTDEWTSAQVWRAIGIGMQLSSVLTSLGKWIIKKSPTLEKDLKETTLVFYKKLSGKKRVLKAEKIAKANIVDYDNLDDVGKEWYALWKQYAPNNQTFDEFKAITNDNLDEMKQMVKSWDGLGKGQAYSTFDPELSKTFSDYRQKADELDNWYNKEMIALEEKYQLPEWLDSDEYKQLRAEFETKLQESDDNREKIYEWYNTECNAQLEKKVWYDSDEHKQLEAEFETKLQEHYDNREKIYEWYYTEHDEQLEKYYNDRLSLYDSDEYKQLLAERRTKLKEVDKSLPSQQQLADDVQLKNLSNVVNERVDAFDDVLASNPELREKLQPAVWKKLNIQQKTEVAQMIMDEYATRLGTPKVKVVIKKLNITEEGYYRPNSGEIVLNSLHSGSEANVKNILTHEYAHFVDDVAPNMGALGEQYKDAADYIYSSKLLDGYEDSLEEQSAFAIGNATAGVDDGDLMLNVVTAEFLVGSAGELIERGVKHDKEEKKDKDKRITKA